MKNFVHWLGRNIFCLKVGRKTKPGARKQEYPNHKSGTKTKPELAVKLVKKAIEAGIEYDFIGGDGLYGHNAELTRSLDKLWQFYVLDVHKDEPIFLSEPTFSVPERKSNRGRTPTLLQLDIKALQLQNYIKTLSGEDFTRELIRKSAKGWKYVMVHTVTAWHWDGKEEKAQKRTLVITQSEKIKYSLSNGNKEQYTNKEWAYFQCSRYWVERCFDDSKNELGCLFQPKEPPEIKPSVKKKLKRPKSCCKPPNN